MRLRSMIALSLLGLPLAPASGTSAAEGLAAAPSFCGPKQAFGIAYGSPEDQGIHMSFVSSLVSLPLAFRPYDSAEVVVTLVGRRRYMVHAQADFRTELRAAEAMATVRKALQDAGWVAVSDVDGKPSTSLYSSAQAIDPNHPHGRVAETFILGTRLYFSCWDAAWKRRADREMPPRPPQQSAPVQPTAQR